MKIFSKENLPYWLGAIILLFIICFVLMYFSESQIPTVFTSSGIVAIISAFIGVILTVFVTSILLNKQTETQKDLIQTQSESETQKDKNVKIYEEKIQIYKEFLSKLYEICKVSKKSEEHVKELILHISYLTMHTSSEGVNNIVSQLKNVLNDDEKKNETLAKNILQLVLQMQLELYGKKLGNSEIEYKNFSELLMDIETEMDEVKTLPKEIEFDRIEMQTYFWNELKKQLIKVSPTYSNDELTAEKIKDDVEKYYAKARNRHRYFGYGFKVYTSKSGREVVFHVEIENDYYYGFCWKNEPHSDDILSEIVKKVSPNYKSNAGWAGWRWPDYSNDATRHDLNFWKMTPETSMKRLQDKSEREELIKEIAQEMDEQIKKFKVIAKQNGL